MSQVYRLVHSGEAAGHQDEGGGVWTVDLAKLDAYLEQLENGTAEGPKTHSLNPAVTAEDELDQESGSTIDAAVGIAADRR